MSVDTDAGSTRRWLAIGAVVVAGLIAGWFCLRAMVLGTSEREFPLIGLGMTPPSAVSQGIVALNRASARNGLADQYTRDLLQRAARRGPLLADPYVVAGLDASARDDLPRAQRLMEEARRRDPRNIIARYWLFDNYLRSGDYARGVAEAEPLIHVQPAAAPAAVAVLTALIHVPAARPALVAALRRGPSWRNDFVRQAAASPALRDDVAALLQQASGSNGPSASAQRSLMAGLLAGKRYADAYATWLNTLPPKQRPARAGIYDGGFNGLDGGEPFGWKVKGAIAAAPDAPSRSGLAIRVGGDRSSVVAEQLVLATPGPLRLSFATRALDNGISSAGLKVQLLCGYKGRALGSINVEDLSDTLQTHTLNANMPTKCGAVTVRMSVLPGLEAGPLNALLTDVKLEHG